MLSRFDIFKMQFSSRRPSKCHGMTLLFNYAVKAAVATMFVGTDAQNQCVRGVRTQLSDAFSIVLQQRKIRLSSCKNKFASISKR